VGALLGISLFVGTPWVWAPLNDVPLKLGSTLVGAPLSGVSLSGGPLEAGPLGMAPSGEPLCVVAPLSGTPLSGVPLSGAPLGWGGGGEVGTCDAHPETLAGGPQTDAAQGHHKPKSGPAYGCTYGTGCLNELPRYKTYTIAGTKIYDNIPLGA
jgi:hypothetical protein